jgi:hypothetical protein
MPEHDNPLTTPAERAVMTARRVHGEQLSLNVGQAKVPPGELDTIPDPKELTFLVEHHGPDGKTDITTF